MWISPALDKDFFCKGTDSCFRAWVGALSGWAAVAAAVVTLGRLGQQIDAANEHQRENVELTIAARLTAAKAYAFQITAIKFEIETVERLYPSSMSWPPVPSDDLILSAINRRLRVLHELLTDSRIQTFETEIGTKWPAVLVTKDVADICSELDNAGFPISEVDLTFGGPLLLSSSEVDTVMGHSPCSDGSPTDPSSGSKLGADRSDGLSGFD